jgi:hypothetical protein
MPHHHHAHATIACIIQSYHILIPANKLRLLLQHASLVNKTITLYEQRQHHDAAMNIGGMAYIRCLSACQLAARIRHVIQDLTG